MCQWRHPLHHYQVHLWDREAGTQDEGERVQWVWIFALRHTEAFTAVCFLLSGHLQGERGEDSRREAVSGLWEWQGAGRAVPVFTARHQQCPQALPETGTQASQFEQSMHSVLKVITGICDIWYILKYCIIKHYQKITCLLVCWYRFGFHCNKWTGISVVITCSYFLKHLSF